MEFAEFRLASIECNFDHSPIFSAEAGKIFDLSGWRSIFAGLFSNVYQCVCANEWGGVFVNHFGLVIVS